MLSFMGFGFYDVHISKNSLHLQSECLKYYFLNIQKQVQCNGIGFIHEQNCRVKMTILPHSRKYGPVLC